MALKKTEWIWHNGKLIPWDEAQDSRALPRRELRLVGL